MILGMPILPDGLTAGAFEVDRGRIEEDELELVIEEVAPSREQSFLDPVFPRPWAERCRAGLVRLRQRGAQPPHGAIQLMEAQRLGVRHAVVLLPPLGHAVAARGHQPVEHRGEDRTLDAEAGATRRQLGAQHVADPRLAPEAIEHQARTHGDGFGRQSLALRMGVEHDDSLGEPSQT